MSIVWNYATKRKNPLKIEIDAVCGRCEVIIKCVGGSTSVIAAHLKNKHQIDVKNKATETNVSQKRGKTMLDFVQRRKVNEIVSDMATDGISIRAITRNTYIRESIQRDGYNLPLNESRVKSLIHGDYDDKKAKMIQEIKSQIEKDKKFSMNIDEYSTVRRRRYFVVKRHIKQA